MGEKEIPRQPGARAFHVEHRAQFGRGAGGRARGQPGVPAFRSFLCPADRPAPFLVVQQQHVIGLGRHFMEDRPFVAAIADHHVAAGGVRWCFAVEPHVKLYIGVAEILAHGPSRAKPIGAIAVINTERFQGRRHGEFSCVRHCKIIVTRLPNYDICRWWVSVAALLARRGVAILTLCRVGVATVEPALTIGADGAYRR